MKKAGLILAALLLFPLFSFSQLNVIVDSSANNLAQAIMGSGVTVSNASLSCNGLAVGTFNYSGSTLGVTNGIILTSGHAADASLNAQIVSQLGPSQYNGVTDPDLTTITSGTMNDVCYVTFDFVPLCNQVSITYEFGSSEYDGFQCAGFNDAFGIFLSGPNPGGGTYTSVDMATLPNGTPVTIDNVNNGGGSCTGPNNPTYFIDNSVGTDVVYYGLTTAITSVKAVVPCSTYHMKIAICDISDEAYDSGVFIQGNSVSCPTAPTVTVATSPSNCSGSTGSATATVTNYTGTPTYTWSPGGANTATISNLPPGTYTCTVGLTLSCGNITQSVTATVGQTGSTLSLTTSTVSPSCNNGTNGSATVNISGGVAPFTTTWNTTPAQNTTTAIDLTAGSSYIVTVSDNAGCVQTATAVIANPAPIVATTTTTTSQCSASNGSATAIVSSGGTAPYSYTWATTPPQNTQTASNIGPGTYSVTVADMNGCTTTTVATVVSVAGTFSINTSAVNPSCSGGTNGTATANPAGGTGPFTYSWNTTPSQSTSTATNLPAGTYVATITDNSGCAATASVTLNDPAPIVATATSTPSTCAGSNGTATGSVVSGGTAPYSYLWISTPAQNTQTATGLAPGTYSVFITDANNCVGSTTITVGLQGGTWIASANTPTNVACFGGNNGAASVSIANPGANAFTYSWNTSPTQATQNATNVPAGNYTCTITDANGCSQTTTVTITQPTALTATVQSAPTTCTASIGTATVTGAGGTAPYTYSWNTSPVQATSVANNLGAGSYIATVTDANTCTVTVVTSVSTKVNTLTVSATSHDAKCLALNGGVTINSVGGGQPPYTYLWSSIPAQTTQSLNNVGPGIYNLGVTDAYGCTNQFSETVGNTLGLPVSASAGFETCHDSSGTATAAANGTAPYSYVWSTKPVQTTKTATGLTSGTYWVKITDANGCVDSTTAIVTNKNDVLVTNLGIHPDGEINAGDSIVIAVYSNSGWSLDSAYLQGYGGISAYQPMVFPVYGDYNAYYHFTSAHGCVDSVIYPIHVVDYSTLYIPSAFSPNDDKHNDHFKATGTQIESFEMSIYDRWGNLVIVLDNLEKSWDGRYHGDDALEDVYVYKVRAQDIFGKKYNLTGVVRLIR
ncbi:MAG: choice-of-anchor L domain-containing protein [Bacteroidia bacterium]